ncbi:hypothetical protein, partial [Catenuloplanes japonicus]|uniref:hypothetical protein n=1 Tax=Catenuloplanes japonicus TaxID=33876 RepID=UPI001E3FEEB5
GGGGRRAAAGGGGRQSGLGERPIRMRPPGAVTPDISCYWSRGVFRRERSGSIEKIVVALTALSGGLKER